MPTIDPQDLTPNQLYDLVVLGIQPRPIAFVSTISADGALNLAPFSFFMAGGANPGSLAYSPVLNKRGEKKDSVRNVEETGEFVVNMVDRQMAEAMNLTSFEYPAGHSEWEVSGLTPVASEVVKPPRVSESPVQFECKLFQIVEHGNGPTAACYVIGEIVRIHAADRVWDGTTIDPAKFRPISRMGGPNYLDTETLEIFAMTRPSGTL